MMMRRAVILVSVLAVVLFTGSISKPASADVSFSFFYSNLSSYGTWAVSAEYGRVWRPYDYEPGWNPYYDGHWVYTDYGWTWVSDYAWGAIPYHYGTWALDAYGGWIWIPGYVWAPSWVVFSSGPDYIGWAPVPPRFVVGASIGVNSFSPDRSVVVPARSFLAPHVGAYVVPRSKARVALSQTHIVDNISVQNHVVVNRGPDPRSIERAVGSSVRAVPISHVKRVVPDGQFDAAEIRADRHDRGAAPRATAPEPAHRSEPARPSGASPRPSGATRQPETSRAPAGSQETPREPGHNARPYEPHGQQGSHPSKPPKPAQPQPEPQKPPQGKPGG
jgi:uncharacterized protein DUF6600